MICKAYRYLFYKYHSWALWLHGEKDGPHVTALGTMVFLLFANLMTLESIILIFTRFSLLEIFNSPKTVGIVLALVLIPSHDFYFTRKKRYKEIEKEFKGEDRKTRIKGNIFAWSYIFFS